MRRWIAIAALTALPGVVAVCTASCGSQQGADALRGDAAGAGEGDGAGGGDSTTGGYSPDGSGLGDDGGQGTLGDGSSMLGADSTGGDDGGESADSPAGSDDGGGNMEAAACVPATACPAAYHCGRYVDPCTGNAFVCGSACTGGDVCASDDGGLLCQAKTCTNSCGIVGIDGCGVPINCGGCTGGKVCINNACVAQPTTEAGTGFCEPLTCTVGTTHLCGTVADVCGDSMNCTCSGGLQCIDGVCSPTPPECGNGDAGYKCGTLANACGSGNVTCSSCPSGTHCNAGMCDTCPAPTCPAGAMCGTASNACGTTVNCGAACGTNQVCNAGVCCTHSTCAEAIEAGAVMGCGAVDLGCGVHESCLACDGGDTCTANACVPCVPKTCADYGNVGCGHAVGCGSTQTLDCCAAGTTCVSGICCPPGQENTGGICCTSGEVNYGGTCCKPACNLHLSGAQVSCGVTLFCGG